ncbi:MAG: hypothetical protein WBN75_06245 [Verrucomicrobiia bacterium]
MSAKLKQAPIDGEPHNSFGFLSAAGVVNSHDDFTKRQVSFPAIGFHGIIVNGKPRGRYGVFTPYARLDESCPDTAGRLWATNIEHWLTATENIQHSRPKSAIARAGIQHPSDRRKNTWRFGVEC